MLDRLAVFSPEPQNANQPRIGRGSEVRSKIALAGNTPEGGSFHMAKKICSADEAVADVFAGASICVGGFGPARNRPDSLLHALARLPQIKNLTLISNGFPNQALAEQHQVGAAKNSSNDFFNRSSPIIVQFISSKEPKN